MSNQLTELDLRNEKLKKLREPFPDNLVGWLPKPMLKKEDMDKIPKINCPICGQYHAKDKVMHLSYVGHAALTDRLLDVDPAWSWEPVAVGQDGYPVIDKDGGMWIRLTILGVTKMGYGEAAPSNIKSGGNATKERIGDALRNAAMRFGCALEMWHKGDLHAHKISEFKEPEDEAGNPVAQPEKPAISNDGLNKSIAKITSGGDLTIDRLLANRYLNNTQMQAVKSWQEGAEWTDLPVDAEK